MASSLETESLARYETERAQHEPAWIAKEITLEEYRAKVDPLWDAHLTRVAATPDPTDKPTRAKKTTPQAKDTQPPQAQDKPARASDSTTTEDPQPEQ